MPWNGGNESGLGPADVVGTDDQITATPGNDIVTLSIPDPFIPPGNLQMSGIGSAAEPIASFTGDIDVSIRLDGEEAYAEFTGPDMPVGDGWQLGVNDNDLLEVNVGELGTINNDFILHLDGTGADKGLRVMSGGVFRVQGDSDTDYGQMSMDETSNLFTIETNTPTTQGIWIKQGTASGATINISNGDVDLTTKLGKIATFAYNTSQVDFLPFSSLCLSTENISIIGGGFNTHQEATSIEFWTAAAVNTLVGTLRMKIESTKTTINNNIFNTSIKSGATQVAAGAAANEFWKTASHATLPDNVVLIGV